MKLIMDSDALIKLTKAGAKELIARWFEISIPSKVLKIYISEEEYLAAIREVLRWEIRKP